MEEKQTKSSEEIDLLYFLRPINNALKKIMQGLENYILLLRLNKLIFFGIIFLVTLAGFCLRYIIAPAYETEGIFISNLIPAKYCSVLVENLNKTNDVGLLSKQLKINRETAETIRSIKLIPMSDTFALENKDSALSLFSIKLIVTKINNLDTIQSGLINYLENNEYARKRKEARIRSLHLLRESLRKEIQSLDSLKTIVNNSITPRSQGQGIILGEPINPISVYQAEVSYQKEILKIEESLSMSENIEVLQPLLTRDTYNYPKYDKLLLNAFLASLVAALLITPLIGKKLNAVPGTNMVH